MDSKSSCVVVGESFHSFGDQLLMISTEGVGRNKKPDYAESKTRQVSVEIGKIMIEAVAASYL